MRTVAEQAFDLRDSDQLSFEASSDDAVLIDLANECMRHRYDRDYAHWYVDRLQLAIKRVGAREVKP